MGAVLVGLIGSGVWFFALRSSSTTPTVDRHTDQRVVRQSAATLTGNDVRLADPSGTWTESPSDESSSPKLSTAECDEARAATAAHRTATAKTSTFENVTTGTNVSGSVDLYSSVKAAQTAMAFLRPPDNAAAITCIRQTTLLGLQDALFTSTYQPTIKVDVQSHVSNALGIDGVMYSVSSSLKAPNGAPVTITMNLAVARVERGIVNLTYADGLLPSIALTKLEQGLMQNFLHTLDPSGPPLKFSDNPNAV